MSPRKPKIWFAFAGLFILLGVVGSFSHSPMIGALHVVPAAALAGIGLMLTRQGTER